MTAYCNDIDQKGTQEFEAIPIEWPECRRCKTVMVGENLAKRFCSIRCKSAWRKGHGPRKGTVTEHACRECGVSFAIGPGQHNKWICSDSCRKSRNARAVREFHARRPQMEAVYRLRRNEKRLPDSNQIRFYRINPGAPRSCESCGESRVLIDPERMWPVGRLADDFQSRLADGGQQPAWQELPAAERGREAGGDRRPGPTNSFWRDADWLRCRDGKWRPVKPGSFPMVDGSSLAMVRGCDPGESVDASPEARVMRLKGYGNAIVAQVAAEFISAYMEISR